jgi:hypothetical protein
VENPQIYDHGDHYMRHDIKERLVLFANNAQITKKGLGWTKNVMAKRLVALIYGFEGRTVDCNSILRCHGIIKSGVGITSFLRGNMSICIASMLSLQANPQEMFERTISVYDMLREKKLKKSEFLAVAAYQIASNAKPEEYPMRVERMRAFYDGIKAYSWFNAGKDDYIFAASFALSDADVGQGVGLIGELYQRMRPEFRGKGNVLSLAEVLVIGGLSGPQAADRVSVLRNALRTQRVRLDKSFAIPSIGVLALLNVSADEIAREIGEAQALLKSQKGFGMFSVSKMERQLLATAIVAYGYSKDSDDDLIMTSLSTSIINLIIAVQVSSAAAAGAAAGAAAAASG